jgi:predicted TIM-barrel fold metal-dependent hydrolase
VNGPDPDVNELLERVELVDHHTHSIVGGPVAAADYEFMLSESDRSSAAAAAGLDTQIGFAARRWIGPLLGLRPNDPEDRFLGARLALTNEKAAARLLPAAGLERLIVDTGFRGDEILSAAGLGVLAKVPVSTVVRLEAIAERLALEGVPAAGFGSAVRDAVEAELAAGAVGLKSIIAYRAGLDVDPARPRGAEVVDSADRWLREVARDGRARLVDPVLLRLLLWTAVDTGRPLQVHTGFGDPDLDLDRADPLLLTEFLRQTDGACPVLLLHCYPFHRNAGYLAQMFAHVYVDVGLAINYVGAQAPVVLAESLELAPFRKVLFSSDAWGLPDLHLLGSWLFRRAMARAIGGWVAGGDWSRHDALHVIELIAFENARRVYGLPARG